MRKCRCVHLMFELLNKRTLRFRHLEEPSEHEQREAGVGAVGGRGVQGTDMRPRTAAPPAQLPAVAGFTVWQYIMCSALSAFGKCA